ncbi:MAG: hypothetical protein O8C66_02060 [Candidatus Methanoperedens sp.]|nr:hypothetical protein [Candidatus Methanoperedens sp.]MCZ7369270.1 hypothetical protein [Candidatus Methanoperedens sp.]
MQKVCTDLSDIEYSILKNLRIVEGENGDKLRNLLRYYIFTTPELKSSEYALKRFEDKKEIEELTTGVMTAYNDTDNPMEKWTEDIINKLTSDLVEINVLTKVEGNQFMPSNKFKSMFKMLLHDIATESKDIEEYQAAVVASIQLLKEFGGGSLSMQSIRDGSIYINENWMYAYAGAMKRAREFKRTKKIFFSETEIAESFSRV